MATPTDEENQALRARVARFLKVDGRRQAIGAPVARVAAEAGVTERSYRRWQDGDRVPSYGALRDLERAIVVFEREAMGQ